MFHSISITFQTEKKAHRQRDQWQPPSRSRLLTDIVNQLHEDSKKVIRYFELAINIL